MALLIIPSAARADCASPAGTAGKVVFDDSSATMQYCNGTSWIKFPRTSYCTGLGSGGWTTTNTGINTTLVDIAYGNGIYVAVGYYGSEKVVRSTDGVTWTGVTVEDNDWGNVQFLNGLFIATAPSGTTGNRVMTSPDGITWSYHAVPTTTSWYNITYGEGVYVVVGDSSVGTNNLLTSTDAVTWTPQTVADNVWSSVAYGNGMFIALAGGGTFRTMTSPDGITWTQNNTLPDYDFSDIAFGNGIFVGLVGNQNFVRTSTDGVTWTTRSTPQSSWWNDIAFGNGMFVAVSSDGTNRIMSSPDGITWTTMQAPAVATYNGVVYGDDEFVLVGEDMPAMIRSGGCSVASNMCTLGAWSHPTAPAANEWQDVVYGNGIYVAVAGNGTSQRIMRSTDGITWTAHSTPTTTHGWTAVAYGNGVFTALTWGNAARSTDGITWTEYSLPTGGGWSGMAYGNGRFVAVASNQTATVHSTDGITWTAGALPQANYWNDVRYLNGQFIAVAATGTNRIMTSPDGLTWTARTPPAGTWYSVAYGEGLYVAVEDGSANPVMTSPDAITWTERTAPAQSWTSIAYGNGRFAATGWSGADRVMTSDDGINWTVSPPPITTVNWGSRIMYANGQFIAVSSDGGIMRGSCLGNCTNPTSSAGNMIYNNDRRVMQWCDGTRWQSMGPDNVGGTGSCYNPTGNAGAMVFNQNYKVAQYCNGNNWVAIGKTPGGSCPFDGAELGVHLRLDEGTGTTTVDSTGNNNTGTLTNGPTWATGQLQGAVTFDGTDDRVTVTAPATAANLGPGTWSFWARRNSAANGTLIYKSDGNIDEGWWIDINSAYSGIGFTAVHSSVNIRRYTSELPAVGTWFHVAVTWTGSTTATTAIIYINGAPVGSYTTSNNGSGTHASDAAQDLILGAGNGGSAGFFNGSIDDVRIYNRVLTAAEIATLYAGCDPKKPCGGIGRSCSDGTVYAGKSPDGNKNMYISSAAMMPGYTWGSSGTARGTTSMITGLANTNTLAAFGAVAHPAAHACWNLTANSHSDWYLPAGGEQDVLETNRPLLTDLNNNVPWTWSSTEMSATTAYEREYSSPYGSSIATKSDSDWVVCVRRDP